LNRLLEIACFSAKAAVMAEVYGAQRIELCRDYCEGGLTPSTQSIEGVKENCSIPLHVIIRPRAGNFIYTKEEEKEIFKTLKVCRELKVNGIVFGALTPETKIDLRLCKKVIESVGDMTATFHRAIDTCENINEGIEELIKLGFKRVLTSGGAATAIEGIKVISKLQHSFGNAIIIIPGGGVRSSNIVKLIQTTNCQEYHSSAIKIGSELPSRNEIASFLHALRED
jgi:copper homeostasis protein